MATTLRAAVIERARSRCEYCRLTSEFQVGGFVLDHILPRSAGGPTELENLAFACPHCNLHKLDHRTGLDEETGDPEPLFNPRTQQWSEHFRFTAGITITVVGTTACGRATINRLDLNHPELLRLRSLLAELGYDCRRNTDD
jgi:hypothetical protein